MNKRLAPVLFTLCITFGSSSACLEPTTTQSGASSQGGEGPVGGVTSSGGSGGSSAGASASQAASGLKAFFENLPEAMCTWIISCSGGTATDIADCRSKFAANLAEKGVSDKAVACSTVLEFYAAHASAIDACLSMPPACGKGNEFSDFCPAFSVFGQDNLEGKDVCKTSSGAGGSGQTTKGTLGIDASAVGAWTTTGTNCKSGAGLSMAFYLCPGGRIRGAGEQATKSGTATILECGTYTVSPRVYQGCNDKLGCFERIKATVQDTAILGGEKVEQAGFRVDLFQADVDNMLQLVPCSDGSDGMNYLQRLSGSVTDAECYSSTCPAPQGTTSGAYGSCGTDCDCGECWYCESGQCRYGGKGPSGCYRGCSR